MESYVSVAGLSKKNVINLYHQFQTARIANRNYKKLCQRVDFMLKI